MTKNIRKDNEFVNGMLGTVESFDPRTGGVRVMTRTGFRIVVTRYTDVELNNLSYYPLRPGYASSTVMKFQGAELDRVTLYADAAFVPGGFYAAASRVRRGADFVIGGVVTANHVQPAL
jgi:ATP-dependent exoDNAse (exonuclease V) alpha subunit